MNEAEMAALIALIPVLFKTADDTGKFLSALGNHKLTLEQAEADRREADARLDANLQ